MTTRIAAPSRSMAIVSTPSTTRTPRSASAAVSARRHRGQVDDAGVHVQARHVGVEVREALAQRRAVEGLRAQAEARQRLVAHLRVGVRRSGVTERLAMFRQPQRTSARVAVCSSKAPHSRKASWARRA